MPRVSVRTVSDLPPTVAVAVVRLGVACAPALPTLLEAPHPAATSVANTQRAIIAADTARFMRHLPPFLLPNGRIRTTCFSLNTTSWVTNSSRREEGQSRGVPYSPAGTIPRYSGG